MIGWRVLILYRSDNGPVEVEHHIQEIAGLHDLVERGPHWDTISRILVTRANAPADDVGLTLEMAAMI